MIEDGLIEGPQNLVRDVGGTGNLQELTTDFPCHGFDFFFLSRHEAASTGATVPQSKTPRANTPASRRTSHDRKNERPRHELTRFYTV